MYAIPGKSPAEKAVITIPYVLVGVVLAILLQVGWVVWRDGRETERNEMTREAARETALETKAQINTIAAKVDTLFQTRLTSRDIEGVTAMLADHESRIRNLERSRWGADRRPAPTE